MYTNVLQTGTVQNIVLKCTRTHQTATLFQMPSTETCSHTANLLVVQFFMGIAGCDISIAMYLKIDSRIQSLNEWDSSFVNV